MLVIDAARSAVVLDLGTGSLAGPEGTVRFSGIERFEFTDGRLVLDAESTGAQLLRLYRAALDRLPDDAGLAHWSHALTAGATLTSLADAFLHSREFALRFGTPDDAGFARLLADHLDTPGLALGIAEALAAGASRAEILAEVAQDPAARQATASDLAHGVWDAQEIAGEIARLYHLALGRSPDAAGWTRWTEAMMHGTDSEAVAAALLGSREFHARHGSPADAAELVHLLLGEALGHVPTAAEAAPWLAAVADGLDAPELLLAMAADSTLTARFVPVVQDGVLFA